MVAVVQEEKIDLFADIKKHMWRFRLLAFLAIIICLALSVGATFTVVYSARLSMDAFEDLPLYRVNILLNDYRDQVAAFDQSFADVQSQLDGEAANRVLSDARALAESVRAGEEGFGNAVALYGQTIDVIVQRVRGAREWNRHFQADIAALKQASDKRRATVAEFLAEFPEPASATDSEQEPEASE